LKERNKFYKHPKYLYDDYGQQKEEGNKRKNMYKKEMEQKKQNLQ
jgi:hypothetical protein